MLLRRYRFPLFGLVVRLLGYALDASLFPSPPALDNCSMVFERKRKCSARLVQDKTKGRSAVASASPLTKVRKYCCIAPVIAPNLGFRIASGWPKCTTANSGESRHDELVCVHPIFNASTMANVSWTTQIRAGMGKHCD
jgi:hypothetical protein